MWAAATEPGAGEEEEKKQTGQEQEGRERAFETAQV